jgi:hypothetical protein
VGITISGAMDWHGQGRVVVSDAGAVTMTGAGSAADDSSPPENFTLEAQIDSC